MQQTQNEAQNGYSPDFMEQEDQRKELNFDSLVDSLDASNEKERRSYIRIGILTALCVVLFAVFPGGEGGWVGTLILILYFAGTFLWLAKGMLIQQKNDFRAIESADFVIDEDAVVRKRIFVDDTGDSSTTYYCTQFYFNNEQKLTKSLYDELDIDDRVYLLKRKDRKGAERVIAYFPESQYRLGQELEWFLGRTMDTVSDAQLDQKIIAADDDLKRLEQEEEERKKKNNPNGQVILLCMIVMCLLAGGILLPLGLAEESPEFVKFLSLGLLVLGGILLVIGLPAMLHRRKKK